MKYTRFVIGCLLAGGLLAMTACGAKQPDAETTGKSEMTGLSETTVTVLDSASVSVSEETTASEEQPFVEQAIRAVLIYRRSVSAASSGKVLYTFTYIDAEQTVGGQTLETPIDLRDPLSTEGILNQVTTPLEKNIFDSVCADLYREEFYLLPEEIVRVTADGGSDEYIVICYEDGTMFISHGHAARKNNEQFKQIFDYVERCRILAEASEAAKKAKPE